MKEVWDSSALEAQNPKTVDAMVHILNLHWSDDLLSSFKKIKKTLKPKGLMLVALLGERTLQELKAVFTHVEAAQRGYVTPRFLPLPTAGQVTSLVQEAGFSNPVLDREIIMQEYDTLSQCYEDLRGMGGNKSTSRTFPRSHHTAFYGVMYGSLWEAVQHKKG